jgi:hypothetical protein
MPVCQRIFRPEFPEDAFAVTDITDEQTAFAAGAKLCGKPAFYKQVSETGDVVIWICVGCFNEFEVRFGMESWTAVSKFEVDFDEFEEES